MIKYVIFDLTGTLIDQHSALEKIDDNFDMPFLLKNGIKTTAEEFKKAKDETDMEIEQKHRKTKGIYDPDLWTKIICGKIGIQFSKKLSDDWDAEFKKYLMFRTKLMKNTKEILEYLKMKYTLILLTNSKRDYAYQRLDRFKIKKYFDYVFVSEDIGAEKSSLLPFKHILKKTGAKPEEHIMIGDRADEDVLAKRVGMKTVLLHDERQKYYKETEEPDFRIKKLVELKKIL